MTYQLESERLAYLHMLEQFRARGDARMVKKLEAAPPECDSDEIVEHSVAYEPKRFSSPRNVSKVSRLHEKQMLTFGRRQGEVAQSHHPHRLIPSLGNAVTPNRHDPCRSGTLGNGPPGRVRRGPHPLPTFR